MTPSRPLVARSLERVWEDKLRAVEAIEQEYARWRSEEPVVIGEVERASLLRLGENLPKIWRANTTSADERKRIPRFIVREVVLDQKRDRGVRYGSRSRDKPAPSASIACSDGFTHIET